MALDPNSSLGDWLGHPRAGAYIRELLSDAGVPEDALGPVLGMPLQQLVVLSDGAIPPALVEHLTALVADDAEAGATGGGPADGAGEDEDAGRPPA
ncbi:hypothetical protein K8F61_14020 [Microbacterium resistens]|uniref:DUF3263 domain-containing protein n=1 Tax=Microbacterium resistens TaxID=156977 RepID=A0ABY3RPV7_9MICO|nr:hypothetical protein [Microbacterium resistens]UGS25767.1 hypothetical protein K8F61_14020 [Microbacterium resistens]